MEITAVHVELSHVVHVDLSGTRKPIPKPKPKNRLKTRISQRPVFQTPSLFGKFQFIQFKDTALCCVLLRLWFSDESRRLVCTTDISDHKNYFALTLCFIFHPAKNRRWGFRNSIIVTYKYINHGTKKKHLCMYVQYSDPDRLILNLTIKQTD